MSVLLSHGVPHQPEHPLLNPEQVVCAVRAHVQRHPGLGRNGVDRRPTLNRAHRERGFGISGRLHVCDLGDGTAHGVNGAWTPELLEAMPAWSFKGHLVTVAPGRLIDDAANAQAINGDEPPMSAWSRKSARTPRRFPSSSSPTVPTKTTSPTVLMSLQGCSTLIERLYMRG